MGIHKNIRDTNPLVLYTFDRTESYIGDYNTGYSVNKTEFDFEPLMIKNSALFYKVDDMKTLQPALSDIEQTTRYHSFSSGPPTFITMGYTQSFGSYSAYMYTLNNGSVYADANLADQMPLVMNGNNSYSIFMQFSGYAHTGQSNNAPLYRILSDIRSTAYFGMWSTFELTQSIEDFFKDSNDSIVFGLGYNSQLDEDMVLQPVSTGFGYYSTSSVVTTPFYRKEVPSLPYPYPMYYRVSYNTSRYFKVFEYGHIRLYGLRSGNNVALYMHGYTTSTTAINYIYITTVADTDIASLYFVIDNPNSATPTCKIYINGALANQNIQLFSRTSTSQLNPFTSMLTVGIKTEWIKSSVVDIEQGLDLYESISPNITVRFDNIAIYNRVLTNNEISTLYYSNYNYITIHRLFGYYQLYDFAGLYTPGPTRYLESGTQIPEVINNTSYLYISSDKNSLPYVVKNNAVDFEYIFKTQKNSLITTGKNAYGVPISMIRSNTGTLSFMFRTSDSDGIIFSNSHYHTVDKNFTYIMSFGYLELWIAGNQVFRISDIANNEWHSIVITFENETSFYVNGRLYHTHPDKLIDVNAVTVIGNSMPGNNDIEADYALIGVTSRVLRPSDMEVFQELSRVTYSAHGQVTLNNIAVGTNVFIYNRHTGALIEKLVSDSSDGLFTYVNRYPYTISVVVTDSTLISGKSYIVDPVELE